ncbi:hypothetical protein BpHYR1_053541 [Brachionus plicatilis]|uniref:Uncharacterized protein n=1 Tax=Brachionus plicatilis TaxID=10195 RepID=A0A3M7PIS9_BRAPC|nr:hypothetical protein BpHYR1_053541 [Brachionus plicatilis]
MALFKSDFFLKILNKNFLDQKDFFPSKELLIKTFFICLCLKIVLIVLNWIRFLPTKNGAKLKRTVSRYDNGVLIDVDCSSIDLCQKNIEPYSKKKSTISSIIGFPFLPIKFLYQTLIDKPFENLSVIFRLIILILIELKSIFFNSGAKRSNSKFVFSQNIERFNQSLLERIDKDTNSVGGSLKYRRPKYWLSKKKSSYVSISNDLDNKGSSRFKIEYKLKKLKSNHLFLNLNKKNELKKSDGQEKTKKIIKFRVDQTTYSRKTSKNLTKLKDSKNRPRKILNVYR